MRWACASHTHRGNKRQLNEDALLCSCDLGLWAVADGMGGHEGGALASQAIVEALAEAEPTQSLVALVDQVDDLLLMVNGRLRALASSRSAATSAKAVGTANTNVRNKHRTIGSTVVTMLAREQAGVALWAGDSRLYRLRGNQLVQITRDHNPLSDLLEDGLIAESLALQADTNIITRAVGGQNLLHLDVALFDIVPWDTYLLCSDGLYRELTEEQLAQAMLMDDLNQAADWMLATALQQGARDNVTLVLLRAEC